MNKDNGFSAFKALAFRMGLSEPTIRKAFAGHPTTWRVASRISKTLEIPVECFSIKIDGRYKNGRDLK